jgi:hypothetical protein
VTGGCSLWAAARLCARAGLHAWHGLVRAVCVPGVNRGRVTAGAPQVVGVRSGLPRPGLVVGMRSGLPLGGLAVALPGCAPLVGVS